MQGRVAPASRRFCAATLAVHAAANGERRAAPKAATFSCRVHATHLQLQITRCYPLKLQMSHCIH